MLKIHLNMLEALLLKLKLKKNHSMPSPLPKIYNLFALYYALSMPFSVVEDNIVVVYLSSECSRRQILNPN